MNKYKPVIGSMLSDVTAQKYGTALEALAEDNQGLSADIVVDSARPESSPLHDWFEWDLDKAALQYWKEQARSLIRSINVVVQIDDRQVETRAFCHVFVYQQQDESYQPIIQVLSDLDLRKQMIEKSLKELDIWQKKYNQYNELSLIFEAIGQLRLAV